jgi:hypothetical protein
MRNTPAIVIVVIVFVVAAAAVVVVVVVGSVNKVPPVISSSPFVAICLLPIRTTITSSNSSRQGTCKKR